MRRHDDVDRTSYLRRCDAIRKYDVVLTKIRRFFDVLTSYRRKYDVVSTSWRSIDVTTTFYRRLTTLCRRHSPAGVQASQKPESLKAKVTPFICLNNLGRLFRVLSRCGVGTHDALVKESKCKIVHIKSLCL